MRFLIFFLFISLGINAQNVSPARIQSLHHADIFLYGAGYTYEYAFAPRMSVSGGISLLPAVMKTFWSDEVYRGIYPCFSADTRRYGNFAKRLAKGKNTGLNSANFWSLLLEYVPDCALAGDSQMIHSTFLVTPRWGLRRSFHQRFLFEFTTGLGLQITKVRTDPYFHLGLKVGFGFGQK